MTADRDGIHHDGLLATHEPDTEDLLVMALEEPVLDEPAVEEHLVDDQLADDPLFDEWREGPPMAITELPLGAEGPLSVVRAFFRGLLGEDWEARLVAAGAAPPEDATDEDLVAARFRAVEAVKAARPDLVWTDDLEDMVDEGWFTLRVHVE